jgi:hypothetical protein
MQLGTPILPKVSWSDPPVQGMIASEAPSWIAPDTAAMIAWSDGSTAAPSPDVDRIMSKSSTADSD